MAATQRAGRMRGKRILLSQAIRQQNIKIVVALDRALEEGERKDVQIDELTAEREGLYVRIDMLLDDLARTRAIRGHAKACLAVVAPPLMEA